MHIYKAASTSTNRFKDIGFNSNIARLRFLPEVADENQKPIVQALLTLRGKSTEANRKLHDKSLLFLRPARMSQRGAPTWDKILPVARAGILEARIDKEGDAPDYRPLPAHLDLCCPGCKHTQRMVGPNPKNGGKWRTFWCTSCSTPWPANKWTCSCNRLWAACAAHFRWDGQSTKRKRVDVTTNANATRVFGEIAPELRRRRTTIVTTIGRIPTDAARLCEPDGGTFSTPGTPVRATSSRPQVESNRGITRPLVHRKRRKKCW